MFFKVERRTQSSLLCACSSSGCVSRSAWLVFHPCGTLLLASASDWCCSFSCRLHFVAAALPPPLARRCRSRTATGTGWLASGLCGLDALFDPILSPWNCHCTLFLIAFFLHTILAAGRHLWPHFLAWPSSGQRRSALRYLGKHPCAFACDLFSTWLVAS